MLRRLIYRIILLLIFWSVFEKQAEGQEYPWSLQYVSNMQTINPAYVGIWDRSGFVLSTKTNWVGMKGAPLSQYANYSTSIKEQRSGLGISIQRLNVGLEKRLILTGDYSYRLRIDLTHYLQMGIRAGIVNYDNNLNNYQPYPDYIPDPYATADVRLHNMTTFGMGAVFFSENYYISLSAPQIINNTFSANLNNFSASQNFKTIYLSSGYVFSLRNRVRFRPNLLVAETIGKPVYVDAAALIYLPSDLQFGVNIRSTGLICFFGQYLIKQGANNRIRIGYAADYSVTSDIRKFQLGTYEILVGYDFNIYKRKFTKPVYF